MSEVLQIHMRPLLVRLRTHRPRGTLALEDLVTDQDTSRQANALPVRCDVLATLQKLPPLCLTRSKVSRAVIAIRRGELGYYLVDAQLSPEEFNHRHGITPEQVAAMENGALYGWEVPEADPDIVRGHRLAGACDARDTVRMPNETVARTELNEVLGEDSVRTRISR